MFEFKSLRRFMDRKRREALVDSVNHGVKFFDRHYPGWHKHVKTSILNMSDGDLCIGAQVENWLMSLPDYPIHHPNRNTWDAPLTRILGRNVDPIDYGLNVNYALSDRDAQLNALEAEWSRIINARKLSEFTHNRN